MRGASLLVRFAVVSLVLVVLLGVLMAKLLASMIAARGLQSATDAAVLTTTIAVCTRGRPPSTASARKSGKIVSPKRGSESSGHRSLGTLSGIARLRAANSP